MRKRTRERGAKAGDSIQSASDKLKAVVVEIRRVRTLFKEIASTYVSKMESRVLDLIQQVESLSANPERMERQVPLMLKCVRDLSVKPAKGRRKDLKKLELLLDELGALAEESQPAPRAKAGHS
ncbi:hypothetical protein HY522_11490 [bacterium]|nr:hypothetical protein [bacterium]